MFTIIDQITSIMIQAPMRASQMIWSNFLSPWIFSGSDTPPEEAAALSEKEAKKQRRMELKQRRGW